MSMASIRFPARPGSKGGAGLGQAIGAGLGAVVGGIAGIPAGPAGIIGGASGGMALGVALGGATAGVIRPSTPPSQAQTLSPMERRLAASSPEQSNLGADSSILKDSLLALRELSPEQQQQHEEPLMKAYVLSLARDYQQMKG